MIYQQDRCEIFLSTELTSKVSGKAKEQILKMLEDKPKEMWNLAMILQATRLGRRPMLTEEYIINLAHRLKEGTLPAR